MRDNRKKKTMTIYTLYFTLSYHSKPSLTYPARNKSGALQVHSILVLKGFFLHIYETFFKRNQKKNQSIKESLIRLSFLSYVSKMRNSI